MIIGDLAEQYRLGRSRTWYWRQVFVAILTGLFNECRENKLLTARALIFRAEFFDPKPEQQNVVLIDAATLQKAQRLIAGCEACSQDVLQVPARCLQCGVAH